MSILTVAALVVSALAEGPAVDVVYTKYEGPDEPRTLWWQRIPGGPPVNLTPPDKERQLGYRIDLHRFSPDGTKLTLTASRPTKTLMRVDPYDPAHRRRDFWLVDLPSAKLTRLNKDDRAYGWGQWSPNSRYVAATANEVDSEYRAVSPGVIAVFDTETGKMIELKKPELKGTGLPTEVVSRGFAWDLDSRSLVAGNYKERYRIRLSGGAPEALPVTGPPYMSFPNIGPHPYYASPDGTQVVVQSNPYTGTHGYPVLQVLKVGVGQYHIPLAHSTIWQVEWAPDCNRVALIVYDASDIPGAPESPLLDLFVRLYSVDLRMRAPKTLRKTAMGNTEFPDGWIVGWSQDSEYILFVEDLYFRSPERSTVSKYVFTAIQWQGRGKLPLGELVGAGQLLCTPAKWAGRPAGSIPATPH
jgi:hypothetical protein